ncbi:MAG: hypothetical protein JOZ47_13810 [Kutzneria sp.]|nr:hypothetical protein [Kutzneria sp.]
MRAINWAARVTAVVAALAGVTANGSAAQAAPQDPTVFSILRISVDVGELQSTASNVPTWMVASMSGAGRIAAADHPRPSRECQRHLRR